MKGYSYSSVKTALFHKRYLLRSTSGFDSTGLASTEELPVSIMLEPPIDANDARFKGFKTLGLILSPTLHKKVVTSGLVM